MGGGGGRHRRGLGERDEREERGERDESNGEVGGERYIGSLPALRRRKVNVVLQLSGPNLVVGLLLLLILLLPTTVQTVELDQQDKVFWMTGTTVINLHKHKH